MTREARPVLFVGRVPRIFGEANRNGFLSAASLDVVLARAVTCLTAKFSLSFLGCANALPMTRVLEVLALIRVACDADFTADVIRAGG